MLSTMVANKAAVNAADFVASISTPKSGPLAALAYIIGRHMRRLPRPLPGAPYTGRLMAIFSDEIVKAKMPGQLHISSFRARGTKVVVFRNGRHMMALPRLLPAIALYAARGQPRRHAPLSHVAGQDSRLRRA